MDKWYLKQSKEKFKQFMKRRSKPSILVPQIINILRERLQYLSQEERDELKKMLISEINKI